MKLLVTMGNTFDCKIRFAVFRGVQWYVILYDGILDLSKASVDMECYLVNSRKTKPDLI